MAGLGLSEVDLSSLPSRLDEEESLTTAQGLGIAPTVASATPSVGAAPAAAPEPRRRGGAIGNFLVGIQDQRAAMQGRETSSQRMKREALESEAVQMQRAKLGLDALSSFRELAKAMPPEAAQQLAATMGQQFGGALPGFDKLAMWSVTSPGAGKFLETMGDAGDVALTMAGGNAIEAERLYREEEWFRKTVDQRGDSRRMGRVVDKLGAMKRRLPSLSPEAKAAVPVGADGQPQLSTFTLASVNRFLPEEERLTELEMETINRNPAVAQQFGIQTAEMIEQAGEERIKNQFEKPDGIKGEEVRLAAQILAAGHQLPGTFSPETRSVVGGWNQADAANFLKTGQSSGITISKDERGEAVVTIGGPGGEGGNKKLLDEVAIKEPLVYDASNQINSIIKLLEKDPGAPTLTRKAFSVAAGLAANADEAIKNLGMSTADLTFKKPLSAAELQNPGVRDAFEAVFPDLAGKDAEYQAMAYNLVYTIGALRGSSGQSFSDKEQANTMKALGLSRQDSKAIVSALRATERMARDSFKTRYRIAHGKEYAALDSGGNQFSNLPEAELRALNELPPEQLVERFSVDQLEELSAVLKEKGMQ